jgi:neutral ceramidase
MKDAGLTRKQIMTNASHSHTGPLMSLKPDIKGNVAYAAFTDTDDAQRVVDYTKWLQERMYEVMMAALDDLQPAHLDWGSDAVTFVMNRRTMNADGVVQMVPNPKGPVDPVVPVLKATGADGNVRALLFGCACHNTGLTGDHNVISGDYAGYAQEVLETRYPGAIALFKSGCGADANPEPRTDIPGVRKLGLALADAVTRAVYSSMRPVHGELRFAYRLTDLPLKELSADEVNALAEKNDVVGLMTKHMKKRMDAGLPVVSTYTAPIAAWSFGDDLTMVAFPSETVAEYALNLRAEHPDVPLWVSGYSNDLFGYVPTAQIQREGGHETIGVTTWIWGTDLEEQVGLFSEEVEDVMMTTARELIREVRE